MILINKIQFKRAYVQSGLNQSDTIYVYLDEDSIISSPNIYSEETTGISVYVNLPNTIDPTKGSGWVTAAAPYLVTSGGPITYDPYYVDKSTFEISFCFGTELVKTRDITRFPYSTYYTSPDAVECGATPATCDLIVIGNPAVTEASTSTTADGEIIINALSSETIEYKLNEDFIYGQGQSSNTFTGLLPGRYYIYLKDAKNCSANVYVDVPYTITYGIKYQLTYYDLAGFQTKIDIEEADYAGAINEYKGSETPLTIQLRGEGSDDKLMPLIAAQINLGIAAETDGQYSGLYTNDPDKYRVRYYKDTGSGYELKLVNKLLPYVYQEDYGAPPYIVSVSGTDGLAELKDYAFVQKDGTRFYGKMSLIKIIAYCLSFTRMNLSIKVACNIYADGMTTTAADDPLDQAYVDTETFYLSGTATVDYVLASILQPFGARLIQWGGYWNIVRVDEMVDAYDYRVFDTLGDYVSNSSFNPVLDIDYPELGDVEFNGIPNLELRNGYGLVTVNYNLGLKKNILNNGDFRLVSRYNEATGYTSTINIDGWSIWNNGYVLEKSYEIIDAENVALVLKNTTPTITDIGTARLYSFDNYTLKMGTSNSLKISVKAKVETPFDIPLPYIKLRISVKYGDYYLTNSGEWVDSENIISYFVNEYNKYNTFELTAPQPKNGTPIDGMAFGVSVYHAHAYFADYTSLVAMKQQDTTNLDVKTLIGAVATESAANTYTVSFNSVSSYEVYDSYLVTFPTANTGSATININSLGAKTLKKDITSNLASGDIVADGVYIITYDGTDFQFKAYNSAPVGFKTEYRDSNYMYYYQLEEITEAADDENIIQPNDYEVNLNPVQWVLKFRSPLRSPQASFYIDFIKAEFQTNGTEPLQYIVRSKIGEQRNRLELKKELIIGSDADEVVTEGGVYFDFARLIYGDLSGLNVITTSVLSSEILYTAWLRDVSDNPYNSWTRDGVSEADRLHMIYLWMLTDQYNRTWRMLRCKLVSRTVAFGLLNSYKEVNDSNRIYVPIGGTIDDKNTTFDCELFETYQAGGSREHSSAFSGGHS